MKPTEFEQYKNQICSCRIFKNLNDDEIRCIVAECEVRRYAKGDILQSGYMYIILSGSIRIEKNASDGRAVTMSQAAVSSAVNAASVLLEQSSLSALTAQEDSVILEISNACVHRAIESEGTFAINFAEFLTDRIRFLNEKIASLAGYSAYSRLKMYLIEHKKDSKVMIPVKISEFAEFLGVGRASLYRAFECMEEQGLIERSGKCIRITGDLAESSVQNS